MEHRLRAAAKLNALPKYTAALILALALLGGQPATPEARGLPRTWYVATNGSDATGDGSLGAPFAAIQHGIDVAVDGDTVLALPGTYREIIDFRGKDITVSSLFLTTGNQDYILSTVIDGGRNGHVVSFSSGETSAAVLTGMTVSNGYATGASIREVSGGGIFCWESPGPTLSHLRVINNEAAGEGGGLYFANSAAVIRDVYVTNNRAGAGGGGVRYSYGSIDIEDVVVVANTSDGDGGGMHLYHAEGTIRNALIVDNVGGAKGGGLGFDGCSPTFTHVTIAGNRTRGNGGGLNVSYMSQPVLINSIVWGNSPEQIFFDTQWGGQAVTVEYSDVEGGQAGIVTNGHGPVHWGQGNIAAPPRFANPSGGNYRLSDSSPAIGAGRVESAPGTDIEGRPRPNPPGSKPDMGAYEHLLASPQPATTPAAYLPAIMAQ